METQYAPWSIVKSLREPEMYAVQGAYLVADFLPIEDARLIAASPELLKAAKRALRFIANTEGEMGETLESGDMLRAAIAKAIGEA